MSRWGASGPGGALRCPVRSTRRGGLQRRPAICCGVRRDAWTATSRWRGSRGGEATEGAELGDEHERALAGRPERPRSLGGRVVDPSHREGARASDGGRPCLGDSWGLRARGWSVLAAAREVGVSRTTGAAGGTLWVPRTLSCHATWMYSCTRPSSRSRRSGLMTAPEGVGVGPVGGR